MATDNISIYYQNCRGLRTKTHTLYMNILSFSYDVIVITESWLTLHISDREFIDQRYIVFRCDRDRVSTNKKDGGGVFIAVSKELRPTQVPLPDTYSSLMEHVIIQLPSSDRTKHHIISAVYLPPKSPESSYTLLLKSLNGLLTSTTVDKFYLFGDYNLANVDWSPNDPNTRGLICSSVSPIGMELGNFMSFQGALQYNVLQNHHGNTLDLLISNTDCNTYAPNITLSKVDAFHPPFVTTTSTGSGPIPLKRRKIKKLNYHKANYSKINLDLTAINWESLLCNLSVDDMIDTFYNTLYGIIRDHTPYCSSKSANYPLWFSAPLIHLSRNKNKAWIKWKKYRNISDYETFSLYRTRFKTECDKCFSSYIESVEESISNNVKHFWTYVSNRRSRAGIPSTMTYHNQSSNDPVDICNMFSDFFQSVYEPSTLNIDDWTPPPDSTSNNILINNVYFSESKINLLLRTLDTSKSAGPDGIPAVFLVHTANSLSKPLHIIFNECVIKGVFPSIWKIANIAPVHKSGSRVDVGEYRPISLLSILSKVFERLVHNEIYPHLHNSILQEQHGFVKRRSTVTNLMIFTGDLFKNMDKGTAVDAVYTDFRKAFDKVDHELLLKKIAYNGIRGNLLRWFASYIDKRSQRVVINGYQSDLLPVTSGVPQGSILGPLLFILFINDINQCFQNSKFLLYADDLKAYRPIQNVNDCHLFQADLDRFSNYCIDNKLHLNLSKCNTITFTKKRKTISFKYALCNTPLKKVDTLRDLGVTLDTKLHLDLHIGKIINKAVQMCGFVLRACTDFKSTSTYLYLYKGLIRPQLEYAVTVWDPFYNKYTDSIERVQRKFLRAVHYRCFRAYLSYDQLLSRYNLPTLKSRRTVFGAMILYGLCHNFFDCIDLTSQIAYLVPRTVHRREVRVRQLFAPGTCRTNAGERVPLRRLVNNFNSMFSDIDIFSYSKPMFKKILYDTLHVSSK